MAEVILRAIKTWPKNCSDVLVAPRGYTRRGRLNLSGSPPCWLRFVKDAKLRFYNRKLVPSLVNHLMSYQLYLARLHNRVEI
jgi:hypothetical protein